MATNVAVSTIVSSRRFQIAMMVVAALVILALDIWDDVDINVGVLYIIVVFLSLRFYHTRGVILVVLCCTVLTALGWYLSPGNTWGTTAITNRLLGLLAVGFATYLGLRDRTAHIALQDARAQLARVNRVATMGELTASIAHEIKQPITGIINNAAAGLNWLAAQPPDLHEVKESFEIIVAAAERASDVTDRIRALVKKQPMRKDALDLNEVIAEVLLLCRTELQRNRISVQTQLVSDLLPVAGDRVHVQQVLLNLILNAVEAMRETSTGQREIVITSTNDSLEGVLVMVRDLGRGLGENDLAKLFTPFYTSKPEGMGMGLTISRSIVERHGGRLWATQNERNGATFHLWLPSSAADQRAPKLQPSKLNL